MLPITFPENFYMAALNIDEEKITENINGILEQFFRTRLWSSAIMICILRIGLI